MEYGSAIILDELASLELTAPSAVAAAVYDRTFGVRLLYEAPTAAASTTWSATQRASRAVRTSTRRRTRWSF
jgi:hypothetical protein